ncbi:MAG: peptidyl-prolyl cis-trans isomerase [Candidatus Omnitrophica bacterium]|jgi:peptidyl-prolyl cis-trans isomerase C|nr:peptidyl-prolyl cis-trans isomerase [Candidatus Omnitrophota bacterium]
MYRTRLFAVVMAVFAAVALTGCCQSAKNAAAPAPEASKGQAVSAETAKQAAPEAKGGKVVAEIGSEKITLEEINEMIKQIPEQYQPMAEAHKDMFVDSVVNQRLLYNEASKLNLDKDAAVQKQLDEARKEIIIKEFLRKEIEDKVVVTDEDAKKYYEANKDKFKEGEKIQVSHILVETEAEANDALAKLQAGADFAALAKEKSKCPSKDKGGDLGPISKGQTVPEFENAAFALQVGQLSPVVKSQFGYHIIKVTEKQPEKLLSFDEVKEQLKQMLLADKQKESFDLIIKDLKDRNKVVIYKDLLMPPAPKAEPIPAK